MKLIGLGTGRFREHPHIVSMDVGRNVRWSVDVGNEPVEASDPSYAFHAGGMIDGHGAVTEAGLRAIVAALTAAAPASRATLCVVWSPTSCTFVMPDGSVVDGRRPPTGDHVDPADYEHVNGRVAIVRYVRLPEGCPWPFLCIRNLGVDHVELSSGERLVLGHFDELPATGPGSDLRRHLDAQGRLVPPRTFRDVATTGAEGHALLGPVQPSGHVSRVVAPWPTEVFAACEEIAERRLPRDLLEAVWRAVDPTERGVVSGTVAEAA